MLSNSYPKILPFMRCGKIW